MEIGGPCRNRGALAAALVVLAFPAGAGAATIKVTEAADDYTAGAGGDCSLREGIQAANTNLDYGGCVRKGSGTADTLKLRGGTLYARSRPGADDTNVNGDLDLAGDTRFSVKGKGDAIIDANGFDRVIHVLAGAKLHASHVRLVGGVVPNGSLTIGGGVANQGGELVLRSSVVAGNAIGTNQSCICGGGVGASGGVTKLLKTTVKSNSSPNLGGGVAFLDGKLIVKKSTIKENSGSLGAGLSVSGGDLDVVTVSRSTISGNEATLGTGRGGGIYAGGIGGNELSLENVTISGNKANASGAGIYQSNATVSGNALTITANTADADISGNGGGGGVDMNGGGFRNSIIAGNQGATTSDSDCTGSVFPSAHNLVGIGTGCDSSAPSLGTERPRLKRLRPNGGATETHALKRRSPAVDAAKKRSAPKRDQRGKRRGSHPDIGAFER